MTSHRFGNTSPVLMPAIPIIAGFHPDPSICRVANNYYLVTSSFEYFPGVPIFHSTDLLQWTQIGNVLDRVVQFEATRSEPSGGIYAPTLRFHDGRYYLVTTAVEIPGQLLVVSDDPRGPWSDPIRIRDAIGIDPDMVWDDADRCWLSWAGVDDNGNRAIMQARVDPESGGLLTTPHAIWHGTGGQHPEGPHLYRIAGWWYLVIAEGGTERGHYVSVARSPAVSGPFQPAPDGPLLTARSTNLSTQNTGHADLVERPDGTWAMVFLGVRPSGMTPRWHTLGRETFAVEVEWANGWPAVTRAIEGRTDRNLREQVTANDRLLPPAWVAASNDLSAVAKRVDDEWVIGGPRALSTFVGRRQEHFLTSSCASFGPGNTAGIELRIDPHHRVSVERTDRGVQMVATAGAMSVTLGDAPARADALLEIRTETSDGAPGTTREGPDTIIGGFYDGVDFHELGRLDGRYLSTEVAAGFTGRMVGISVPEGEVIMNSFVYVATETAS